jgi:hypothetical protein
MSVIFEKGKNQTITGNNRGNFWKIVDLENGILKKPIETS